MTDQHDDDLSKHFEEMVDSLSELSEPEDREIGDAEKMLVQTVETFESEGAIREETTELLSDHLQYE